ncbi:hypothetical protein [Candidatus Epulonipiscium viviparus]|uniref:hypothetical protein n=1 Tax=Candidatus Epulonipiscium viviparus TaxID=420336 RepID=UPI00016C01C3|nr:hypothetical protein [Candidatus Epulopiscium viviparus]
MSNQQSNTLDSLVNNKITVYSNRYSYSIIVSEVCQNYMKGIELGTGQTKIFNLADIAYIEYILP